MTVKKVHTDAKNHSVPSRYCPHLSHCVIKGTKLCEWYESGVYLPPTLAESVELVSDLMMRFAGAGIAVIRVGLHASEELERNMVAGAYHPAFRELCEGEIYYRILPKCFAR